MQNLLRYFFANSGFSPLHAFAVNPNNVIFIPLPLHMPANPYFPHFTNNHIASAFSIHSETLSTNVYRPASLLK